MNDVLIGGDELGALMRSLDWSQTSLGAPDTWPQSLSSAVSICLNSRFPIAIYWGPQLALLYNDAWSPILGAKHPWALGKPGHTVWPEIWAEIGPLFEAVHRTGEGVWQQERLLPMHRHGYTEECYFDFTFSPIRGEDGSVAGIFNAVIEITFRVIEERRARMLRDLSERTAAARSALEACASAADVLSASAADIPFCLFYLREQSGAAFQLAAAAGVALPEQLRPPTLDLAEPASGWPVETAWRQARPVAVDRLGQLFGVEISSGIWHEPVEQALIVPIAGIQATEPVGLLIAGVSPRRALDAAYQTFVERITLQVATAIGNAHTYAAERQRAEALAELDRAKTAFFSNVSHEFRTPLTLILGPLEDTLAQPDGLSAADRERLDVIHRNAVRLLKLVNTLLDFSRIEAGRVQAAYEPTDLAAFTVELASVFRSAVERAGLRLVVTCPPLAELVYVDHEMWEKIVFNLLSNAFKFTFAGEIEVALHSSDARVELLVRDTGTGIPIDEIPHLFERFHRVKGARGRTLEGSGIGLALVQELVKLHGGEVRVASVLDQGTTFTISMPSGTAHLPQDHIASPRTPAAAGVPDGAYVQEALRWLHDDHVGLPHPTTLPDFGVENTNVERIDSNGQWDYLQSPPENPRSKILLADDNADMREYVRRLLSQAYTVVAVDDGAAALRVAREQSFDLVLSDVMMPELDGFGLLSALRADERTRETPVILLSARAGEEARIAGLATGADDYLVKPFSARELLARVGTHLDMARSRQESTRRERQLRAEAQTAREYLERVLAGINDQFMVLDHDGRYVFVNDHVTIMTGLSKQELLGKRIWDVFPETIGTVFEREVRQAAADHLPARFEYLHPRRNRWFEHRVYPGESGLTLFLADITERKAAEQALADRERLLDLLLKISDAARELHAESDIARAACRLVKAEIGATSCSCGLVYPEQNRVLIVADVCDADDGVPCIEGEWQLSSFGPKLIAQLAQGNPVVIEDTIIHPATMSFHQTAFETKHVRSLVSIPLIRDGRFVAYISIHNQLPRRYTAAEVSLLRDVAVRVWEAIQRARAEAELRVNEARQALLLRLLQGQRETSDTAVMMADAAQAVGRYLGANRVGFFEMLDDDTLNFTTAWADGELALLAGTFPAPGIGTRYLAEVRAGRTLGIADTASDPLTADSLFGTIGARAIIGVPIIRGGRWHAGFYINHAVIRHWTDAEIALVRDVGEQTWDAIERARARAALHESEARLQILYAQEQAARAHAEEASRLKDEFLATVSHELRTPLTAFLGYAQMLQRRKYDQAYVERTVGKLVRSAKSQAQIIEDLLDVSRIVSGKMRIEAQPIDLAPVVLAALETVRPAIEAKELHLHIDLRPEANTIIGDPNRLQQVVWNLLSNAAKFTPSGGHIQVRLERNGHDAQLTVSDNGPGINTAFLPYAFDRFRQADSASNRAHGGLGLGLAIVRHLLELHGGTVQVSSAGTGQGTTFTIRLPLLSTDKTMLLGMTSSVPGELGSDAGHPPELDGLRILVVDDQPDILELVQEILGACGAIVRMCTTARDALETVHTWQPELLVSDIAMPDEDGYWLIHNLRKLPPSAGGAIPAIALTAYVRMEERLRVLAAGFQLYVPKPVEPAELRNVVARLARTVATD